MGKLTRIFVQKILPSQKKQIEIRFRRKTGRWLEFDVPPSKKKFVMSWNKDKSYQLIGEPDIDDSTNQRLYTFFEDVTYPVKTNEQHPGLMLLGKEAENIQLLLAGEAEQSFQKSLLIKSKKDMNYMMWGMIIAALNLVVTIIGFYLIADKLGIRFA